MSGQNNSLVRGKRIQAIETKLLILISAHRQNLSIPDICGHLRTSARLRTGIGSVRQICRQIGADRSRSIQRLSSKNDRVRIPPTCSLGIAHHLSTVTGPLLNYAVSQGLGFIPLRGERDQEHQFGLTIPLRRWSVDVNNYHQRAHNYFDHNAIGNSNVFFPLTVEHARLYGWEVALRSPRLFHFGEVIWPTHMLTRKVPGQSPED